MSNLDDIKNIDESLSDIYSIQEYVPTSCDKNKNQQPDFDEIVTLSVPKEPLPKPKYEGGVNIKRTNETNDQNRKLLLVPQESKPLSRLYGSTKHLFQKQLSMDVNEETPFLLSIPTIRRTNADDTKISLPKQETGQRSSVTDRRKSDDVRSSSELLRAEREQRDGAEGDSQC